MAPFPYAHRLTQPQTSAVPSAMEEPEQYPSSWPFAYLRIGQESWPRLQGAKSPENRHRPSSSGSGGEAGRPRRPGWGGQGLHPAGRAQRTTWVPECTPHPQSILQRRRAGATAGFQPCRWSRASDEGLLAPPSIVRRAWRQLPLLQNGVTTQTLYTQCASLVSLSCAAQCSCFAVLLHSHSALRIPHTGSFPVTSECWVHRNLVYYHLSCPSAEGGFLLV